MPTYRFLDGMGDVVAERDFGDHAAALAWARDPDLEDTGLEDTGLEDTDLEDTGAEVTRVEYRGPEGDWRWAGALQG